ncbi:unnamed protein product, partial [marine sediment metagenome]
MTVNNNYAFPTGIGSEDEILIADSGGDLVWGTAATTGACSGAAGLIPFADGADDCAHDADFTWDNSGAVLTVAGTVTATELSTDTYSLPTADGTSSGDVLSTNASGTVSWVTPSASTWVGTATSALNM